MSDNEDGKHQIESILIATLPKGPAAISICCSLIIIVRVLRNNPNPSPIPQRNGEVFIKVFHQVRDRIILGLSISDVISSVNYFLGTWLIPRDTVGGWGPVFMASGTSGTCKLSGFLTQFAVASPIYNATLACYYLFTSYFKYKSDAILKIEKWFHIIPIAFAFSTSLIALCFDLYGNVEWLCWIKPSAIEMTSPQKAFQVFQWLFLFGPIWISIIFQSRVMYLLFKMFHIHENEMKKYTSFNFKNSIKIRKIAEAANHDSDGAEQEEDYKPSSVRVSQFPIPRPTATEAANHDSDGSEQEEDSKLSFVRVSQSPISRPTATEAANHDSDGSEQEEDSKPSSVRVLQSPISKLKGNIDDLSASILSSVTEDEVGSDCNSDKESAKSRHEDEEEKTEIEASTHIKSRNIRHENEEAKTEIDASYDIESLNRYEDEEEKTEIEAKTTTADRRVSWAGASNRRVDSQKKEAFLPDQINSSDGDDDDDNDNGDDVARDSTVKMRLSSMLGSITSKMANTIKERTSRFSITSSERRQRFKHNQQSREVALQGMQFVCAFYIAWFFPTVQRITELTVKRNWYWIQLLDSCLLPSQGFFNFLIYIRPYYNEHREENKQDGVLKSLMKVSFSRSKSNG